MLRGKHLTDGTAGIAANHGHRTEIERIDEISEQVRHAGRGERRLGVERNPVGTHRSLRPHAAKPGRNQALDQPVPER